jgi:peptidoglycan/LPS O-acetylase OafA/YrhL
VTYRPDIDGLRAIAVLAVVAFHAGFGTLGGFAGVDVFFVISGYVITRSLAAEYVANGTLDIWRFYERRIRRLLPALAIVLLATVVAAFFIGLPAEQRQAVVVSAASAMVFAANIYFDVTTSSYFATAASHLSLLHLWSLGVEEQFYLVWPWLLVALLSFSRHRARVVLAALIVLSFAVAEGLLYLYPNSAFFEMPGRFWELGAGGMVAMASLRPARWQPITANLSLLALCSFLFVPWTHVPGWGIAPVVLATVALLALGRPDATTLAGRLLSSRFLVAIGRVSYPLYLWHWPLLVYARLYQVGEPSIIVRLGLCTATVVLAFLSDRMIERGARAGRAIKPAPLVSMTAVACLAMAYLGLAMKDTIVDPPGPEPESYRVARMASLDFPSTIRRCHFSWKTVVTDHDLANCISDPSRPVGVVVWGDSHALAMQPFAAALARDRQVSALELSRDSCKPMLGFAAGSSALVNKRCVDFNEFAFEHARKADTVVLAALWPTGALNEDFSSKLASTLDKLGAVRQVLLLGPTPALPVDVTDCLRSGKLDPCTEPRQQFERSNAAIVALMQHLAATHTNVRYIDLSDFFCEGTSCPGVSHGIALYWDTNHISSSAARALAKSYLRDPSGVPRW